MEKLSFAGIPFCKSSLDDAAAFIVNRALDGTPGSDIHFLNAFSVALAETNSDFRDCVTRSDFNFPDGKPIALMSSFGRSKLHQVRGPALFERVMDVGRPYGVRHYLLGSTPETLRKLQESLEARYPGVKIAGIHSPPFRLLSTEELAMQDQKIRASGAHVVWVGLGTPKQDFEASRLASSGFIAAAVGAAFDFSAGTKASSPEWMSKAGLEWFHRLISEPRRLWKRYLWGNTVFLLSVVKRGISR